MIDRGKVAILAVGGAAVAALCLGGHLSSRSDRHPKGHALTAEDLDKAVAVDAPGCLYAGSVTLCSPPSCAIVLAHGVRCIGPGTYCGGNPFDLLGERPVVHTKVTIEGPCVLISPPEKP